DPVGPAHVEAGDLVGHVDRWAGCHTQDHGVPSGVSRSRVDGWPAVPPTAPTAAAPARTALSRQWPSGRPSSQPSRNAALNVSPAPVVSTGSRASPRTAVSVPSG